MRCCPVWKSMRWGQEAAVTVLSRNVQRRLYYLAQIWHKIPLWTLVGIKKKMLRGWMMREKKPFSCFLTGRRVKKKNPGENSDGQFHSQYDGATAVVLCYLTIGKETRPKQTITVNFVHLLMLQQFFMQVVGWNLKIYPLPMKSFVWFAKRAWEARESLARTLDYKSAERRLEPQPWRDQRSNKRFAIP